MKVNRKNQKTKKVNGQDLHADCFLWAPDLEDTNSWRFPVYFPGDVPKTINHIKNAVARFDKTHAIPEEQRQAVWLLVRGAAKAHGVHVPVKQFTSATIQLPEPAAEPVTAEPAEPTEADIQRMCADADLRADRILKALGLA